MKDINILSLFGIELSELEKYDQVDGSDDSVTFLIRKTKNLLACPNCGCYQLLLKIIG